MAHYRTTIASSLQPEAAFAELADFSSSERWDPGVTSARRLDDGPLGVGSRFEVISHFAGRDVPLVYEIVELEPERRLVLRAQSDTLVSLDTITFDPCDGGTSVTYDAKLTLKGFLRLLDPALGIAFRRIGDRARDGLRQTLRSESDRAT